MNFYEVRARQDLAIWKKKMRKKPFIMEQISKRIQNKINNMLPVKYHEIMTSAIKNLTKAVLYGSQFVTNPPVKNLALEERESILREKIKAYRTTAAIEGAATGAGGIILGFADFPLLLGIKIKFLYEAASIYGFDVNDHKERLYILYIFQLAFSSREYANRTFEKMEHWLEYSKTIPDDINRFDWNGFQREYRDYIDLAKLAQLVPGIGAIVGFYVNNNLMNRLSDTAIQAYRMRILDRRNNKS